MSKQKMENLQYSRVTHQFNFKIIHFSTKFPAIYFSPQNEIQQDDNDYLIEI